MIRQLKPYPEYKDSGLPWVDRVPSHWQLIPNRGLIRKRKVLVGGKHREYQLLSLTKQGVIIRDVTTGKGKFSSDMGTSQEVRNGDLVFCLFDVPETPRTVGLSCHNGMITGAYTVFECMDPERAKYFELFYQAMDDRKLLSPLYSGLRNTIPPLRFIGTKTPQPPPEEQGAIVRFLDHTNVRIERVIRAKRKLTALLNEQKQAIIQRAVICGLDSDAALKPSGIQWLSEIPNHWEKRKLKHIARLKSGEGITALQIEATGQYPVFGGGGHRGYTTSYTHDGHFVLIGRQGALCGNIKYARGKFFASEHAVVAMPLADYNVEWFGELLRVMNLNQYSQSAAQPGLSVERIENLWIPYPPRVEQDKIVSQFRRETRALDAALARSEHEMDLLKEYHMRLVADVVTGKLDVRNAAAQLADSASSGESFIEEEYEHQEHVSSPACA